MKLTDIKDFKYRPPNIDISNMFEIEQTTNGDGSVNTFYNINDGVVIDGIDEILPSNTKYYQCVEGDTLKLISWKLYKDIGYWWLLAKINQIDDAFHKFEPGDRIYVFSSTVMNSILSNITSGTD